MEATDAVCHLRYRHSATAVATTARANDITLFASLELSKSKWVVTINDLEERQLRRAWVSPR